MTEQRKKLTLPGLFKKAAEGKPITWLTCYDYPTAYLQEQAGVDMILVGDSLGMTMLGYDSTLPVTMDDMIRHSAAVRRGAPNTWVVGDMPLHLSGTSRAILTAEKPECWLSTMLTDYRHIRIFQPSKKRATT
jgi:Ketopantoate hydroxymethyltransferase